MDWHQIWEIVAAPDNIPIVALLFLVPFYTWYGIRQGLANDRLAAELEADPQKAKTHHRKTFPFKPGWDREVHVWPYLMRIEFLAAIIVTLILMVWSITLDAPLEEPASPSKTPNPAKAPWYFLGLQEMLVYFDPWIAGVILPGLIIVGLMIIPYIDTNPRGGGYYSFHQRKFAMIVFGFGYMLWVVLIIIGTFFRGPGWYFFYPWEEWDVHRIVAITNVDLPYLLGIRSYFLSLVFGGILVSGYYFLGVIFYFYLKKKQPEFMKKFGVIRYSIVVFLLLTMLALPIKMFLRIALNIKYVWVTPWFNI